MFEEDNVQGESLPPDDVEVQEDSSTEEEQQPQETEPSTPQQDVAQEEIPQPEEEQKVPFSRFKEVNEERKQLLQQQQEILLKQQQAQQFKQPTTDPYAGYTAEEKVYLQQRDARMKEIAQNMISEKEKTYQQQIQAQNQVISKLLSRDFRMNHPDVKEGSQEEQQIASMLKQGYPPDHAYKITMWDKKTGEKQVISKQQQQQRIEAKRQANPVSPSSISPQNIPQQKETFNEAMRRRMANEWNGDI